MSAVTVSRQLGSLGTTVAKQLADDLGYEYLDKNAFGQVLLDHGFSGTKIEQYDEKKPPLWDVFSSDRDRFLLFMKVAIFDFAMKGKTVIVGRGGQMLLRGVPGVLGLRVEAPMPLRLERVQKMLDVDARHAEKVVRNSDYDRNGFHRFFFNVNWEESDIYDLIINTKTFSVDTAVEIIKEAIRSNEISGREQESLKELHNLSLAQRVEAHILYEEEVPIQYLEARANEGIVTLRGAVTTMQIADRCMDIARSMDGVKDVVNEFTLINYYGMM